MNKKGKQVDAQEVKKKDRRPLETFAEYKEIDITWYKSILGLYKEGASDVEIKAYIYEKRGTFSNDLFDRWMKDEEEFSETIKMGRMLANSWWEKRGRANLDNKEFNYVGWYMNMKNRYKWKDRQDNTSDDKPIDNNIVNVFELHGEELDEALKQKISSFKNKK